MLDANGEGYVDAVDVQLAAIEDSGLTPSARILRRLRDEGASFFELTLETSRSHQRYFSALQLPVEKKAWLEKLSADSLAEQQRLEALPRQPFSEYLEDYFARV